MNAVGVISTRKMRYTGGALQAMKNSSPDLADHGQPQDFGTREPFSSRNWSKRHNEPRPPRIMDDLKHKIGQYPLTSDLAGWVVEAFTKYQPPDEIVGLVMPYSLEFHDILEKERACSTGLHDLNLVELTYQVSLEVGAQILIAATASGDAIDQEVEYHSSRAARDEHLSPWGKFLTGLECDPPIISQFPFYLMMCQSFTFEPDSSQENYVYSALTGVDWARGKNAYSDRFKAFAEKAQAAVPKLDDKLSGKDRSFWRIALAYLAQMNKIENAKEFTTPKGSYIKTDMDPYILMAARGFDTIGSAFMCSDGAAFLDVPGMDSLLGSALPNDVMDLHTDILTGETRNLLRLLYPNGQSMENCIKTMSTVFSGMLCELFRGHRRARFDSREDGRIAATSPPYSFCRARHRRIFETMEAYISRYPEFWEWTWDILAQAKAQVIEAGINELLADSLYRAIDQGSLPDSPQNAFYDIYFEMVENGEQQLQAPRPLGVPDGLAQPVREIYSLWHGELLAPEKKPGWGREFDERSDFLLGQVGEILSSDQGISDDMYKFAIAYGRLSMSLPYIAYHTIDAIILSQGYVSL